MQPDSLVKLVGSGNTDKVEEEWLALAEAADMAPSRLSSYSVVLAELTRRGKNPVAEAMAAMAIDVVAERYSAHDLLSVAGTFLQAVGESADLRSRVEKMYRKSFSNREGLDVLLQESGLGGGRPVRRALRTLDVCLKLSAGDYLAARDEEAAASVKSIDPSTWRIVIDLGDSEEELGAVELADRFERVSPNNFKVLNNLHPQRLSKVLNENPIDVIIDLCQRHGGSYDSTRLESLLVPGVFSESEWEKWWSKSRTAIRKCKNIKMEGRSPYYLTYLEDAPDGSDAFVATFSRTRQPLAQLAVVEKYLRDCKSQGETVSAVALKRCFDSYLERAKNEGQRNSTPPAVLWSVSAKIAQLAGESDGKLPLIDLLKSASEPHGLLKEVQDDELARLACEALIEARPSDWSTYLLMAFPYLPAGACDQAASRLLDAGRSRDDIESAIQQALASPVECLELLLWLWNGPERAELATSAQPVTVLSRILRALDECRRNERIPKETAKTHSARARSVLSARRYERFLACLESMDRGMAHALRVQINQLENLGNAVRDDLLGHLSATFPTRDTQAAIPPWKLKDTLFVTRFGLQRKQEEINQHVNVKMRDNARAIGAAAEHGDLSENSEYKFALEERDLLRARLAQMNAEVASARILSVSDVPTDHVGIGCRVEFRRVEDGKSYEMTFVGPWEADHAKGWFNYLAPLAQSILGMRIGEAVDFDHGDTSGRYEIAGIYNALSEWDDPTSDEPELSESEADDQVRLGAGPA